MDKSIELLEKVVRWHSVLAPSILGVSFLAALIWGGLFIFGLAVSPVNSYGLGLAVCGPIGVYWLWQHRFPRGAKNSIVFVIAVRAETAAEEVRLRRDFVKALADAARGAVGSTPFSFIELPSYLAEKATDVKSSLKIMDKCRGHFLVFGDIRTRQVNGEQHYAIHLEGMVAHAVVASQVSQILANDMRAVLPKRVEIPYKHELRGFEVTSILMSAGARYTIATAALISGALDLSETLLSSLRRERFPVTGSSAKLQKQVASLKKLIPIRLADVYSNQSARWFQQWRSDRSAHALEKVAHYNELCGEIASDRQRYLTFKAILTFVNTRDAEKALSILLNIKGRDTAAHICYSIAFLQAFKGQLDIAERSYQKAFSLDHDGAVAFEVEEFISWIASEYPEKPQLHYCLGLVNLRVKKDPELAARDFSIFLSRLRSDEFAKQVRFATSNLNGRTIDKEAANDSAEPVNVVPMDRHKFQGKSGANSKLKGSGSIS